MLVLLLEWHLILFIGVSSLGIISLLAGFADLPVILTNNNNNIVFDAAAVLNL